MSLYPETEFSKEEKIMAKKISQCLSSLTIREIQIKTSLKFYLTPVRVTRINKTTNNNAGGGTLGKGNPHSLLVRLWTGPDNLEISVKSPQKAHRDLTYHMMQLYHSLALAQKTGHSTPQITCSALSVAALIIIARKWNQPKCPSIGEWTVEMQYTHTV